MVKTIAVIGGDGIGPEVVAESLRLLKSTSFSFKTVTADAGYSAYEKHGTPLPEETVKICKKADAVLFGAVTTPPNIENYFSPIVRLRKVLNLYANVRPVRSLPIESSRQNIDFTIVRENTEDLYGGHERYIDGGAIAERVITNKASERIIKFAFELTRLRPTGYGGQRKVTVVHKANVLRLTDGLFLNAGKKIAKKFPEVMHEEMLVDSCAMQLIKKPEQFDIIVTTNMFGDILSDEASALVGGLGIASSANIGDKLGLFEPVHGSAPKYQGKNIVNPTATFLAMCMMLEFLGENKLSNKIKTSVIATIKNGISTKDLGGKATTEEFTDAVIKKLS